MELAAILLGKLGCAVLRAGLMDTACPGWTGLQATRALKSDAATEHIKVVVVTSHRDDDAPSPLAAGADAFPRQRRGA